MKLKSFFVAVSALVLASSVYAAKQPNIIFLFADDMRFDAMNWAWLNQGELQTPNLDRLAAKGMRFTNAYNTTAICMASRAQVMAGQYEFSTGTNFEHGNMNYDQWEQCYPMLLKNAGYRTGFAGKFGFHVMDPDGSKGSHETVKAAFDWWGGWMGQGSYRIEENAHAAAYFEKYGKTPEHTTYALGMMGRDFVDAAAEDQRPFCLSISFKAPHSPYHVQDERYNEVYATSTFTKPANYGGIEALSANVKTGRPASKGKSWIKDYDSAMRKYHQLIYGMDVAVGMILDAVEAQGIADNTIIIFTSDNGHFNGTKSMAGKLHAYEEGSRAPLLVYDPRSSKMGQEINSNALVGNIDMAPTILSAAGVTPPEGVQGKSFLHLLENPDAKHHESLLLINVWGTRSAQSLAVVTPEWKYIHWLYGGDGFEQVEELFSMQKDRLEMDNLVSNPEAASALEQMRKSYDGWLQTWEALGVKDRGYAKYLQLGARNADYSALPAEQIEDMGPLAGESSKTKDKKKKKSK